MDLYRVALFAHVVGAILLVGGGFLLPALSARLRRTPNVEGVRDWSSLALQVTRVSAISAAVIFASGLYMALTEWSFRQGWLAVALALFAISGAMFGAKIEPAFKSIKALADAAPDGPVPPELRAATMSSALLVVDAFLVSNDVVIVFLMTNKPNLGVALAVTAVGVAVAAARVARHRKVAGTAVAA